MANFHRRKEPRYEKKTGIMDDSFGGNVRTFYWIGSCVLTLSMKYHRRLIDRYINLHNCKKTTLHGVYFRDKAKNLY